VQTEEVIEFVEKSNANEEEGKVPVFQDRIGHRPSCDDNDAQINI